MSVDKEKALVSRCLNRDKTAWDAFVENYTKLIYSSIYKTLALKNYRLEPDLVGDLHQEVFLSFFKNDFAKLRKFEWRNNSSLATWIGVVTRNLVLDYIRKESGKRYMTESLDKTIDEESERELIDIVKPSEFSPAEILDKKETIEILSKAIDELPPEDKILMELLYYEEIPYQDIAQLLGKSIDAVYMQKKRLVEKLKEIIKNQS